MAGYLVFAEGTIERVNPVRLGLFDLVREFEQSPFPYDRRSPGVTLYGLDETLIQMNQVEGLAETRDQPFLAEVRRRLVAVSNEVAGMGVIHVPIRRNLSLGGDRHLYVMPSTGGKRVPLWRLFGSNPTIGEVNGQPTYMFGENLS